MYHQNHINASAEPAVELEDENAKAKKGAKAQDKGKPRYCGKELGADPTKRPAEGFEWRGRGEPKTGKGRWVKDHNLPTEESFHPDFNHPPPKGPHWDYTGPDGEARLYSRRNLGVEMIKQLLKYKLDFDSSWEYVFDNLDKVNTLSIQLLKLLNFKDGYFFTLLPNDANLDNIYDFKGGLVLPQNPIETHIVNGHKSYYSWIPNIRNELSHLILKEITLNPNLFCLMDDFEGYPKDRYHIHYVDNYSLFYGDEIYLSLTSQNISIELIMKCLKSSHTFWHSLSIFTKANLTEVSKDINLEEIKEICKKTELIMVCAYDGEGYVFWEKNPTNGSKGFFEECN